MKTFLIYAVTENINIPVLPLGLGCIAAAIESKGHQVGLFNATDAPESLEKLKKEIEAFAPQAIGLCARNVDNQDRVHPHFLMEPVRAIVKACKEASQVPVILGGAGFTMFPDQILAYTMADMGIAGQGEESFCLLLDHLEQKTDMGKIPGLIVPEKPFDGTLATVSDLDAWPMPFPEKHILVPQHWNRNSVMVPVQSRRGCALDCSYCSTRNIEGRILKKRSPQLVAKSVREFMDTGFSQFFFTDNTFNLPPSYAHELCRELRKQAPQAKFRAIVYPNILDDVLAENMAKAGCVEVSLGFEHGDEDMLRTYNKKFGVQKVKEVGDRLKRHGIQRMGFLLLGGPGETRESVLRAFSFMETLDLDSVKITAGVRVYPKTQLHDYAVKTGHLTPDQDILHPTFFVEPGLEEWLDASVDEWKKSHPDWVFY